MKFHKINNTIKISKKDKNLLFGLKTGILFEYYCAFFFRFLKNWT